MKIAATTGGRDPDEVFGVLGDFESYPDAAEDIRSITVTKESDTTSVSEWVVAFRGGEMRWSQLDQFDAAARTIRFAMIEGDSDVWEGAWTVTRGLVCFEVVFDLGLPALAEQLNPLAGRALYDVLVAVIRNRIGLDVEILTPSPS